MTFSSFENVLVTVLTYWFYSFLFIPSHLSGHENIHFASLGDFSFLVPEDLASLSALCSQCRFLVRSVILNCDLSFPSVLPVGII